MDRVLSGIKDYVEHLRLFPPNARAFLVGSLLLWTGSSMFALLLNLYFKELGFSEAYIGKVLSIGAVASAILAVPMGLIMGRFTFKSVLTFSAGVIALGYAVQVVTGNRETILVAAFVGGLGVAVFRIASAPFFMRHSTEKERMYLFSMNFAVSTAGALVGSLVGGFLPRLFSVMAATSYEQYRLSLLTAALFIAFSSLPFFSIVEEKPDLKSHGEFLANLKHTDWALIGRFCLPTFIVGLGAGLIIPFLNLYFKDLFGASAETIGVLFAVLQCFMTAGTLMGPPLVHRIGMVRSLVITQMASIPFMVILCASRYFPVVVGSFLLRGALMNMNQPLSTNFAMESVRKEEHAVTNSLLLLAWTGSWAVSVRIGGSLIERYSYTLPFIIAIILYVLSSVLYYYFFRNIEAERFPRHELGLKEI
ncbi:MAG: MFS transporter [Candidatus Eisenbacteria bacterium]|nr:MFS transporter [Candidatus Eisenbacteria bacterium]